MAKSSSSQRWLREHAEDAYVKQAQRQGYRSRAVFKLLEIDRRDHLFKPGMTIVDLGAAPGSWSQLAAEKAGAKGRVIAVDILPMEPISHVLLIRGDFREDSVLNELLAVLGGGGADLVLSDMAPNMSGMKAVDQPRAMYLAELARDLALQVLRPGGDFLTKVFQGEGTDTYVRELRAAFAKVSVRKPKASRGRSPEIYVLARSYGV